MKQINKLYKLYFNLPGFTKYGIAGKAVDRALELAMVYYFEYSMPGRLKKELEKLDNGLYEGVPREEKYIISLTSFPARIDRIWITITTLLMQSFKPDKIVLWLANEQFPNKELPESLVALTEKGLEIRFCEDLRSHKKYYYTMIENPDTNVITVDDDVYYPEYMLSELVQQHKKFPEAVCANFAHKILFEDGRIKKYMQWKHKHKAIKTPSHKLMQVGVGGVLYPPKVLYEKVFNKELFKEVSPKSDDVWLKTMSYLNNTKIVTSPYFNKQLVTVRGSQEKSLNSVNSHKGLKDIQIKNVIDHFNINVSNVE
ncbi:MAG: hypothetical protein WD059_04820 [Balneolaceae bacterium]